MQSIAYMIYELVAAIGGAIGVTGTDAPLHAGLAVAYAVAILGLAAMARAECARP